MNAVWGLYGTLFEQGDCTVWLSIYDGRFERDRALTSRLRSSLSGVESILPLRVYRPDDRGIAVKEGILEGSNEDIYYS